MTTQENLCSAFATVYKNVLIKSWKVLESDIYQINKASRGASGNMYGSESTELRIVLKPMYGIHIAIVFDMITVNYCFFDATYVCSYVIYM